jgi:hypothetical protein
MSSREKADCTDPVLSWMLMRVNDDGLPRSVLSENTTSVHCDPLFENETCVPITVPPSFVRQNSKVFDAVLEIQKRMDS